MVRTQIQLPESQVAILKHLAAINRTSMAEMIRRAVDLLSSSPESGDMNERKERAIAAAGSFHSGHTDIAARHDEYLAEAFK